MGGREIGVLKDNHQLYFQSISQVFDIPSFMLTYLNIDI